MKGLIISVFYLVLVTSVFGQIGVNPTGVNVNSQNSTSVPLTFGPIPVNYSPVEAVWCGELISAAPAVGLQCRPDTIFGALPLRYNRAQRSPARGGGYLFDVMAIPPSVVRRAYQSAVRGENGGFFYVRKFSSSSGEADIFVNVTCRMTSGGARVPFALTAVEIKTPDNQPILFADGSTDLPEISAEIIYNGTGILRGRWELVKPGEEPPTDFDLLTEASLPIAERGKQKRYTTILPFNVFLPPSGKFNLPAPRKLPLVVAGQYQLLLRIEVSQDNESENNLQILGLGDGITQNGAVANFPLPTLKIFSASASDKLSWIKNGLLPVTDFINTTVATNRSSDALNQQNALVVSWRVLPESEIYFVEFFDENKSKLLSAYLRSPILSYRLPARLKEKFRNKQVFWRVTALKNDGTLIAQSESQRL